MLSLDRGGRSRHTRGGESSCESKSAAGRLATHPGSAAKRPRGRGSEDAAAAAIALHRAQFPWYLRHVLRTGERVVPCRDEHAHSASPYSQFLVSLWLGPVSHWPAPRRASAPRLRHPVPHRPLPRRLALRRLPLRRRQRRRPRLRASRLTFRLRPAARTSGPPVAPTGRRPPAGLELPATSERASAVPFVRSRPRRPAASPARSSSSAPRVPPQV